MANDFTFLQARVNKGLQRDDLIDDVPNFINEALIEIQDRRSWRQQKHTTFVTITPGVLGSGGNVVPLGSVWPSSSGTLTFVISGFAIGARYFYNPGNSTGISADGTNPISAPDGFFTAVQESYTLLADAEVAMTVITAAVISAGLDQVAALPPDFKELQPRTSVDYVTDDGQYIPAEVVFEWQQIYRVWAFAGCPFGIWPPRVYYDRRDDKAILGILEPLTRHFNLRVKYYRYLPPLVNPTDVHPIAAQWPNMVINLAKAIGFRDINDPESEALRSQFEDEFVTAMRSDAYAETRGRDTHL